MLHKLKIVFLVAALALTGCFGDDKGKKTASAPSSSASSAKLLVYTTIGILENITAQVGGDKITVHSIVPEDGEVHDYEPKPGDIKDLAKANLLIVNGLGLEDSWLSKITSGFKGATLTASDGVTPVPITEDAYEGKPNPHAWISPRNGSAYAKNIAKKLGELDPNNKKTYDENAEKISAELLKMDADLAAAIKSAAGKKHALVTCEGAFSYVTKDAGLQESFLWATNSEQEGTPQQVTKVINFVKDNQVSHVFCEQGVNSKPMEEVVAATGAQFGGLLYVESLANESGGTITYQEMIKKNIDLIRKALG